MKKLSIEAKVILPILILMVISIITIYASTTYLPSYYHDIYIKQIIYYFIGFILAYTILFIGFEIIIKNVWYIYFSLIILLIALLIFGVSINGSKSWFIIFNISFQPSEFMKIILIILNAKILSQTNIKKNNTKEEFILILKVLLVTLIPSILTFLQPDTGIVIIYLIISLVMLFIKGIRKRWFIIFFSVIAFIILSIIGIYFINEDILVHIFGNNLFYRIDRILNWSVGSGLQLENSITSIASASIFGFGFNNVPLYFPEPQTDFIFTTFASQFGFVGSIFLIILFIYYDYALINLAKKTKIKLYKYMIFGIIGTLFYQQFQNICMTIGILPITGITLPFISYGGSSLLSYMLSLGLVFIVSHEEKYYHN